MLAGRRLDPAASYSFDRSFAEIDKAHVRLIKDIKKVLFEGRSLGAIGVNRLRRCEDLGKSRIFDPRPRFVAPEIVSGTVRFFVCKEVVERANPGRKTTNLPDSFERRLQLLIGHLGCGLLKELVVETPERRSALLVCERIALLHAADCVVVELFLSHR